MTETTWLDALLDRGWVPDWLLRRGIRRLLRGRLQDEARRAPRTAFLASLDTAPIALATAEANAQHYEVPAGFYQIVLGRHLKYSSGYWPDTAHTLDEAEAEMLALTCARAELRDGLRILELGCGWGSLTLWMAAQYPNSTVTAVSNSRSQRAFIEAQATARGLMNVTVITADMNTFAPPVGQTFDRVVSVEMFEHMRNYRRLLHRIAGWMAPQGQLFVHIFTHRCYAYPFESTGPSDWMAAHFFTGGTMPSHDLLPRFQDDLQLAEAWRVNGRHYGATCNAWLARMDAAPDTVDACLASAYADGLTGQARARTVRRWRSRWRIFFMACAELFDYAEGTEWGVSHYRFVKREDVCAVQ